MNDTPNRITDRRPSLSATHILYCGIPIRLDIVQQQAEDFMAFPDPWTGDYVTRMRTECLVPARADR